VSGYQTGSLKSDNYADIPNGYIAFQGLFDTASGLEIIGGLTYSNGTPVKSK
jgi:hypothetical protein